jgi:2-hydroxy-3-oxopropionate reductase
MADIGFIGLGVMGGPMAGHLQGGGHRLFIHTRSTAPEQLLAGGAIRCSNPREVVENAAVTFLMLPDTADVETVLFGPEGAAGAGGADRIIVDMSSVSPLATKEFAQRLGGAGIGFLDAPVSGGEVGAKAATLTIMVGGPEVIFLRVKPYFELMGRNITHVGGHGDGQTAKVANQMIVGLTIAAVSEALVFAAKAGADPAKVREALLGGFAASRVLDVHGQRMLERKFEPGFRIALHHKDLGLAVSGAHALQVALPHTSICHAVFSAALAAGEGGLDHSALVRTFERLANQEVARTD